MEAGFSVALGPAAPVRLSRAASEHQGSESGNPRCTERMSWLCALGHLGKAPMCPQQHAGPSPKGIMNELLTQEQASLGDGGHFVGTLAALIRNSASLWLAGLQAKEASWRGAGDMWAGLQRQEEGAVGVWAYSRLCLSSHAHGHRVGLAGPGWRDRQGEGLAEVTWHQCLPCPVLDLPG